ncbi:MAG: hypothetical protein ACKOWW_02960 [Flavobacteriales bacterium]
MSEQTTEKQEPAGVGLSDLLGDCPVAVSKLTDADQLSIDQQTVCCLPDGFVLTEDAWGIIMNACNANGRRFLSQDEVAVLFQGSLKPMMETMR